MFRPNTTTRKVDMHRVSNGMIELIFWREGRELARKYTPSLSSAKDMRNRFMTGSRYKRRRDDVPQFLNYEEYQDE